MPELEFPGHHVDQWGIRHSPGKDQSITGFPRPTSVRKLREFLGLVNFHTRVIPNCAKSIRPFTDVLKGVKCHSVSLVWSDTRTGAFDSVKPHLSHAALLSHPKHDAQASIVVDASGTAGQWRPVGFFLRNFPSPSE